MLILPPGHGRQMQTPYPLASRERRLAAAIGALAAALAVIVVISLLSSGHSSGKGCVDVKLPYSTGGADFYGCGARARAMCAGLNQPGGLTGPAADAVIAQCRKAGVPLTRS